MGWPQHGEVSVVEGRQTCPSPRRSVSARDAGVDHAQRLICVLDLKLPATLEIGSGRVLEPVRSVQDIVQKRDPGVDAQTLMAPVVELGEHENGHDEVLVGIVQQRARTDRDRGRLCPAPRAAGRCRAPGAIYEGGCAMGSAVSSAAERPSVDLAIPRVDGERSAGHWPSRRWPLRARSSASLPVCGPRPRACRAQERLAATVRTSEGLRRRIHEARF